MEAWPREADLYDWSRRCFDRLAELQERERIRVVLEIDGPNPHFFDGELYGRLFEEFPDLSLCLDTGRLGLLARTHGQDPLSTRRARWLPWTRYCHLHTSFGGMRRGGSTASSHHGSHTRDRWPRVTPAADIARMVVKAQPRRGDRPGARPTDGAPRNELEAMPCVGCGPGRQLPAELTHNPPFGPCTDVCR